MTWTSRFSLAAAGVIVVASGALVDRVHAERPAALRAIEKSYELALRQVALPARAGGLVSVQPCSGCAHVSHALAANTVYVHNDRPLSFADVQKLVVERRRTARPTYVGVAYDVTTNAVTRISIVTE